MQQKKRKRQIQKTILAALEDAEEADGDWCGPARQDSVGRTARELREATGESLRDIVRVLARLCRHGVTARRECDIGPTRYYLASGPRPCDLDEEEV